MKTYIKSAEVTTIPVHFDIEVDIYYFEEASQDSQITASEYKGFQIPEGPLLSGIPGAVLDSKALDDYRSFIDSVTGIIKDYYKLHIYYKNMSQYNSCYFGILAKNKKGDIILDFDFTLRISNHDPHRSKESQKFKKERKAALKKITKGKATRPITGSIKVNAERYDSYADAIIDIDETIEGAVKVMKRREKYQK